MGDLPPVLGVDVEVPVEGGGRVPYANFDVAATAPCLAAVADAVNELLPHYASVHRGAGLLSQYCTRAYERARAEVAGFLGCGPEHAVVFTRNTTDSLNLLARALPAGTRVVTFAGEHHANLLPWPDAVRLPLPNSPEQAVRALSTTLRGLRDGGPLLVAVTGASNVTGELWPVPEIAEVTHWYGGRLAVDVAQFAAHREVRIGALGADYLAASGHKLYAPFGTGVLAGRADWLASGRPYLSGGGATEHVGDDPGDVRWVTGPARHEAGTPNLIGAIALAAACRTLTAAGWSVLERREGALLTRLRTGLAGIPGVRQLSIFGPDHPRVGIVAFTVRGTTPASVAALLSARYGIGVRDGMFCAHPLTRHLLAAQARPAGSTTAGSGTPGSVTAGSVTAGSGTGGCASASGTAIRASLGLGTTVENVDRLVGAVAALAAEAAPQECQ